VGALRTVSAEEKNLRGKKEEEKGANPCSKKGNAIIL